MLHEERSALSPSMSTEFHQKSDNPSIGPFNSYCLLYFLLKYVYFDQIRHSILKTPHLISHWCRSLVSLFMSKYLVSMNIQSWIIRWEMILTIYPSFPVEHHRFEFMTKNQLHYLWARWTWIFNRLESISLSNDPWVFYFLVVSTSLYNVFSSCELFFIYVFVSSHSEQQLVIYK